MEPVHALYTSLLRWDGLIFPTAGMSLEHSRSLRVEGYVCERVAEEEGHTLVTRLTEEFVEGYALKDMQVTEKSLEGYALKDPTVNKLQRKVSKGTR